MAVDLVFRGALNTTHPVNLTFGEEEGGEFANALTFDLTLAKPSSTVHLDQFTRFDIGFTIGLPPPSVNIDFVYDLAVSHGPQSRISGEWEKATRVPSAIEARYDIGTVLRPERAVLWSRATHLHRFNEAAWDENTRQPHDRKARWEQATKLFAAASAASQSASRDARPSRRAVYQEATRLTKLREGLWQEMSRLARPLSLMPYQEAHTKTFSREAPFQEGHVIFMDRVVPWQEARHPPPGRTPGSPVEPPEPPGDPCYVPPVGDEVHLVFSELWDGTTGLLFMCDHGNGPPALVVVPVRRVYMVINESSLWRVEGDVHIPTYNLSMSLDADSWTWSFAASVPGDAFEDVEPDGAGNPVELEVRLNGMTFRVLAESLSRDRNFPTSRLAIRGRGKGALLDAPFAPIKNFGNAEDRTAQQLMSEVLTDNGESIGWDVDWNIDDWLVPGGTWVGQASYMGAVNQIAAAAGAYIQPHRTDQELKVLYRYPTAPWTWGDDTVPDFELPSALTTRESIEWVEKVRYNRVFVSGQTNGILAQVTREGTDGGIVAQMVTDPLITHVDAARGRGRAILSDTGRQAKVSLRVPVLPLTGVIEPGKFVRYVDGDVTRLGIVRSTSVEIKSPDVWQSLVVETHVN